MNTKYWHEVITQIGRKPFTYSGRAMDGKTCCAVKAENPADAVEIGFLIGRTIHEGERVGAGGKNGSAGLAFEIVHSARYDTDGRGIVLYWPNQPPPPAKPRVVKMEVALDERTTFILEGDEGTITTTAGNLDRVADKVAEYLGQHIDYGEWEIGPDNEPAMLNFTLGQGEPA